MIITDSGMCNSCEKGTYINGVCNNCGASGLFTDYSQINHRTMKKEQLIETINDTIKDLVSSFVYYDRKEDDELPRGLIEQAVKDGLITKEQIVDQFEKSLNEWVD